VNTLSEIKLFLSLAERVSQESYCVRKKVGAVLVTSHGVISIGYNGTASGESNVCELEDGTTNPEVLHAESNVFAKTLKAGLSTDGAKLYVTLQPCLDCAKLIYQSGIKEVYFSEKYRCTKGVAFLERLGILVKQITK
tara:strand:- start:4869 stop:5282 length:414 start_codon:yes stop_codon:yes gene_type:complete